MDRSYHVGGVGTPSERRDHAGLVNIVFILLFIINYRINIWDNIEMFHLLYIFMNFSFK